MDFNKIFKVDSTLNDRYSLAGQRERYCATQLFAYATLKSQQYTYTFTATSDNESVGYDGILIVRYKDTGNIAKYILVEIKVRDEHYDELVLEKKKFSTLHSSKRKLDKYFKKEGSDHSIGIIYLNFTSQGSYIFDLLNLAEEQLLPKLKDLTSAKVTVDPTQGITTKKAYFLNVDLATRYKWIYDEKEYAQYLRKSAERDNKTAEVIEKRTGVIF